jgi:A/G-specific adenine glycosylase
MEIKNIPGEPQKDAQKGNRTIDLPSIKEVIRFRDQVLSWFETHGRSFAWRDPSASLYVRIVSEVLLQRTRAETVSAFIPEFLKEYPSWESLANVSETTLAESLRPIGLYHRRAVSLQRFAREIIRRQHVFPFERADLESIPAVGQYVANAILLFAHSSSAPLLDSSMARLLRRHFDLSPVKVDIRYDKLLHAAAYRVLEGSTPILLNWAMLDLAALHCRSTLPKCESCPVQGTCYFASQQKAILGK